MEDAFALIRKERGSVPRAINLISGPSRTGDIEQTIVLGAHGPFRVHILVVDAARIRNRPRSTRKGRPKQGRPGNPRQICRQSSYVTRNERRRETNGWHGLSTPAQS